MKIVLPIDNHSSLIRIYDVLGNEVVNITVLNAIGTLEVNTHEIESGIYFVKVFSLNGIVSESKLIKK